MARRERLTREEYEAQNEELEAEWDATMGGIPRYDMEIPVEGRTWLLEGSVTPATELQAIMEAAPHHEPAESLEEIANRHYDLLDRLDRIAHFVLTDEEREVIEVTVYAGHSIRKAAEILGYSKSVVHRLHTSALEVIRRELEQ